MAAQSNTLNLDDEADLLINLHLAGDYFAELGNLEAAAKTGANAAARVADLLERSAARGR